MRKLLQYSLTTIFGLGIAVLILVARDTFHQSETVSIMRDLCDAFFIPGIMMVAFGGLLFASNGGVFDMLKFSIIKLFDVLKRDLTKVKYRTFYDYREAMKEKNRSFAYILIVGLALTLVAVVFLILFYHYKG